jgi:hypothetical protein
MEAIGMKAEASDHDWYDDISKKSFVKLVSILVAFCAFLGGAAVSLLKDNWELRDARWSDAKWEAISRIGEQATDATRAVREMRGYMENHDARLDRLEARDASGPQIARLADQVQKLSDQLKKGKGI